MSLSPNRSNVRAMPFFIDKYRFDKLTPYILRRIIHIILVPLIIVLLPFIVVTLRNCCLADTNPCMRENGGCDQRCINHNGKPFCQCAVGYQLAHDQRSCEGMMFVKVYVQDFSSESLTCFSKC